MAQRKAEIKLGSKMKDKGTVEAMTVLKANDGSIKHGSFEEFKKDPLARELKFNTVSRYPEVQRKNQEV